MKKALTVALVFALLWCVVPLGALAGDIPQGARETYAQQYGEIISSLKNKGVSKKEFVSYVKRLQALGFYTAATVDPNSTYLSPSIKLAIALFAQCAGLPPETKFTPEIRALLQDEEFEVHPFFAPLVTAPYYKKNVKENAPYTDKLLHSLGYGDKCALEGKVTALEEGPGGRVEIMVASLEKAPYRVRYIYPERSTRFIPGDQVIVYGSIAEPGADDTVCIQADLVGLKK